MDVKGVGALVTGGGSGMGAATARALAAAGARVGVIDLSRETAEAVANEIGGLGLACDVSDAATAEAVAAFDLRRFKIDLVLGDSPIQMNL